MSKVEMFTDSKVRILETIARGLGARDKGEHIIELLREHQPEVGVDSGFVYCCCGVDEIWYTEHLIELIKGETNDNS